MAGKSEPGPLPCPSDGVTEGGIPWESEPTDDRGETPRSCTVAQTLAPAGQAKAGPGWPCRTIRAFSTSPMKRRLAMHEALATPRQQDSPHLGLVGGTRT